MSERGQPYHLNVKALAESINVSEGTVKWWLRSKQMKIKPDGSLTKEEWQAAVQYFANGRDASPASQEKGPAEFENVSDRTILNPNVMFENATTMLNASIRNSDIPQDSNATVINTAVRLSEKYQTGETIGGKYRVISSLDNISGEADLYLCENDGTNYMAKVYRRSEPIKEEVWKKLQTINSPYVVKAIERFFYEGQTVEILPYYSRGSLASSQLDAGKIESVVFCVNEGLKALHEAGIIHKDIKPSNLMWAENGSDVLIIDFGISSLLDENRTLKFTSTGLTLQYAAPETLHNIFSNYSDYYALGVTVYELFSGSTPYNGMTVEQVEKYYSIQNFPIPEGAPQRIKDLILGTTYFDIRNRKDNNNPNCRWSYEQVKKWCNKEPQLVPGQGVGSSFGAIRDYSFEGKRVQTRTELVQLLCQNWESGKEELFSGRLTRHFEQVDRTTGDDLRELPSSGDTDLIFMRALHIIDHGTFAFMWRGRYYQDIKEFAYTLQKNEGDRQLWNYFESAMNSHALSVHVGIVYPKRQELSVKIKEIEDYYTKQDSNRKEREIYGYVMLYRLLGKCTLYIGEREFEGVQELTNYLLQLRLQSSIDFEQFCHELIKYDDTLSPKFEAWLIAKGKQKTVREWQQNIKLAKE